MRISFRADASPAIGSGHIMRCLSLADALLRSGATCTFLAASCPPALADLVRSHGHALLHINGDSRDDEDDLAACGSVLANSRFDWVVVDHYHRGIQWEAQVRQYGPRLLVIDDLANRAHDCDLLLDQNLGRSNKDYEALVPSHCRILTGTRFALLRESFITVRENKATEQIKRAAPSLLITLGGMDHHNVTSQVLIALEYSQLPADATITIVMGKDAPWRAQVEQTLSGLRWPARVLTGVSDMAELMASCDLAITAAGSTVWELCCIGVPMIAVVTAENQRHSAAALASSGACLLADPLSPLNQQLPQLVDTLLSPTRRAELARSAAKFVDGRGCERVIAEMCHEH